MTAVQGTQFLVAYARAPSEPLRTELHRIMQPRHVEGTLPGAAGVYSGVLPCVAGPFSNDEACGILNELGAVHPSWLGSASGRLLLQPSIELLAPLSEEDAAQVAYDALSRESSKGALLTFQWIGAFELPRCWAFLFYQGPYIPSGIGVVIDKHTQAPILTSYIELEGNLNERGFDTSSAPGEGRTRRSPGSRKIPLRQDLISTEDGHWERMPDVSYVEPDGTPLVVEVWLDEVTGLRREIDTERKRFRWARAGDGAPGQWAPYSE